MHLLSMAGRFALAAALICVTACARSPKPTLEPPPPVVYENDCEPGDKLPECDDEAHYGFGREFGRDFGRDFGRALGEPQGGEEEANQAPTFDAPLVDPSDGLADQAVAISGSCTDPDVGDTVTYLWEQTAGTGVCVFGNATLASTTVTATTHGTCTIRLTCSDGEDSANDTLAYNGELLLDHQTAPSLAAWSLQNKLRDGHTGDLFTVIRSSDSVTEGIGTSGDDVDLAELTTFCAATNCFLTSVEDQTTNNRDLTQATAARRPQIVSAGTPFLCGANNVLCADWDGDQTSGGTNGDRLTRTDALGQTGAPAMSVVSNAILDGSIVTDRFSWCTGAVTTGNGRCKMSFGGSTTPNISFVGERTAFSTSAPHVALTTWQWTLNTFASGGRNDAATYATNGNPLAYSASDPVGTEDDVGVMTNSATSWGDAANSGIAVWPGRMSTLIFYSTRIVDEDDDEDALEVWFATR
jgi:hypothetical protein